MLKEVARYGVFKRRDAPNNEVVPVKDTTQNVENVNKDVDKPSRRNKKMTDMYNPFEIYDYDVDYSVIEEEALTDGCDICERSGD